MDSECGLATIRKEGLTEGDVVSHKIFGSGTVRYVYDNGDYCEVIFSNGTIRSLKADKLTKTK